MEVFQDYLKVIDARLLVHINGKPGELIRLLRVRATTSKEELMTEIYGKAYSSEDFRNIKARTLDILQVLAIISEAKGNSPVKKKYDFCLKKFVVGQKFLNQGIRKEGIRLIRQAHKIAVTYDFTHLAGELSSILYHDHVFYHPHSRIAKKYAGQTTFYTQAYPMEKQAEHLFYQVIGKTNHSISSLENAVRELNQLGIESLKGLTYQGMVEVMLLIEKTEYEKIIKCCQQMLLYYQGKKGVYGSHKQFFFMNLGLAQMATIDFVNAENSFMEAEHLAPTKSINQYFAKLYLTINALHAGDYQVAYELYRQNRKCRFERIRLQFALIEAYLCFLSHLGHLQLDRIFRLGKYLNETFKAQTDKQGSNVIVIIAELLVHLVRDRGKFIDRVDAVSHYSYRHLRSPETLRAKRFIKILCLLPKVNFHKQALEHRAAKEIKYLREHPIYLGQNVALEIIPFHHLLEMVLSQLKEDSGRRKQST